MGRFIEYENYDALGLADLVKKKKIKPAELCEEAIIRIEEKNPALNAMIYQMFDIGRETVKKKLPPGPFAGVPFLIKDLLAAYKGVPMTMGSRAFKDYVPDYDSELVKRFKDSGLVIIGKTNTPEFGLMGVTEPELHGPTRNPWNTGHTPGGSSGGSASAVASGMVPMASAGDGGGSIRIPASCCGIFGMKPSRGRNPAGPVRGEYWQGAVSEHVVSRSVRDSAAALDAVCGGDAGAPYVIADPKKSFQSAVRAKPEKLKIAYNTESPIGTDVHPDCIAAVEDAVRLLKSHGHRVIEAKPEIDGKALAVSYVMMYFAEIAADIASAKELTGKKGRKRDFELGTWMLGLLGKSYSSGEFVYAKRQWETASRRMGQFYEDCDMYLTPTMAYPPVKIGELQLKTGDRIMMNIISFFKLAGVLRLSGMIDQIAEDSLSKSPFTQLANLTGLPAMSVPLYWNSEGLPIGVQFIAPFGDEAGLFRLAGQLERSRPWFERRPQF